jgi:hypothetical protein
LQLPGVDRLLRHQRMDRLGVGRLAQALEIVRGNPVVGSQSIALGIA